MTLRTIDIYQLTCPDILILVYLEDGELFYTRTRPFKQSVMTIVNFIKQDWKLKPPKITIKFKEIENIQSSTQYIPLNGLIDYMEGQGFQGFESFF